MSFALSTAWNAFRYDTAKGLLFEIKKLGFNDVELSFNLTAAMLKEIQVEAKEAGINITSLHNYCPIPEEFSRKEGLPDCFSVTSINEDERQLALKYTKRSIDNVSLLGAKALVLHCGRVEIPDRTRQLIDLYNLEGNKSADFNKLRSEIIKERRDNAGPFFKQALASLEELNSYATKKKILIGVETRFYYREIPILEEFSSIFDKFKGSNIFYWHDIGHAQLMENLGLIRHKDFLEITKGFLIGTHLHDICGCSDHKPAGKGSIDFNIIKPFLKKDTTKVIEIHHPATGEEVVKAREYLSKILEDNG
ncbi:MAG: sugar phosphate isomerase/epimerase [Candidatus Omnitrophica bacterium]|nr:sugar phosphate isomerase/epimerase [Candidatus Omnitrophota bacterium]